jgi:hypothetical protein
MSSSTQSRLQLSFRKYCNPQERSCLRPKRRLARESFSGHVRGSTTTARAFRILSSRSMYHRFSDRYLVWCRLHPAIASSRAIPKNARRTCTEKVSLLARLTPFKLPSFEFLQLAVELSGKGKRNRSPWQTLANF